MLQLFIEGGFAMFYLVAFGVASLVTAGCYARRATRVWLRITGALALGTLFTAIMGICVDLAAVGHGALAYQARHPDQALPGVLLQGFGEAMAPGVLGFSFLALTALITTLGLYREPVA